MKLRAYNRYTFKNTQQHLKLTPPESKTRFLLKNDVITLIYRPITKVIICSHSYSHHHPHQFNHKYTKYTSVETVAGRTSAQFITKIIPFEGYSL